MKTEEFLYGRNEELHNELIHIRSINAELLSALKDALPLIDDRLAEEKHAIARESFALQAQFAREAIVKAERQCQ